MSLSELNKKLELGRFLINKFGMLERSQAHLILLQPYF